MSIKGQFWQHHAGYAVRRIDELADVYVQRYGLIDVPKIGAAFGRSRISWLVGENPLPIELMERRDEKDLCEPVSFNETEDFRQNQDSYFLGNLV